MFNPLVQNLKRCHPHKCKQVPHSRSTFLLITRIKTHPTRRTINPKRVVHNLTTKKEENYPSNKKAKKAVINKFKDRMQISRLQRLTKTYHLKRDLKIKVNSTNHLRQQCSNLIQAKNSQTLR